jgi:hypothetical protein
MECCKKLGRAVRWTCRRVGELVTGEWWFWWGRPNGGTVILRRSLQVSLMLYLIGLWLRSLFNAAWPWHLDFGALWHNGAETVPWLGAIFGAVYAALYARFASQWSYLAGVYNQLRQTLATLKDADQENDNHMQLWKAGFVEDALDLHLATKPMFGPFVQRLLDDPGVSDGFDAYTVNGEERRERLQKQLQKRFGPLRDATQPASQS